MSSNQVCRHLDALLSSESINCLESLPQLDPEHYTDTSVVALLTQVCSNAQSLKRCNVRHTRLNVDQTHELVKILHNTAGLAEKLEELDLGDLNVSCTQYSG